MSDLMKRLGNAYDILWNNKEFPTCEEWRSELIPAVQALEAKVEELEAIPRDEADGFNKIIAYYQKQVKELEAQIDEIYKQDALKGRW